MRRVRWKWIGLRGIYGTADRVHYHSASDDATYDAADREYTDHTGKRADQLAGRAASSYATSYTSG